MRTIRRAEARSQTSPVLDERCRLERFGPERMGNRTSMEVSETDREVLVAATLPGMGRGDVEIDVADDLLVIRGEMKDEHEEKGEGLYLYRRSYSYIQRSLELPVAVEARGIRTEFDSGVVRIRLPKAERTKGRAALGIAAT